MQSIAVFHPVQVGIIHALTFCRSARFSELKMQHVSSDRFSFHLKRLLENDVIEHTSNHYRLTNKGKGIAGQIGSPEDNSERHPRVGVLVCCVRENTRTKKREYLIQERLKHPFFGCFGCMATKVRWGETVEQAAKRGLREEQGLSATLTLVGVKHKVDASSKVTLEDKYFFVFRGESHKGTLIERFDGGKNSWMSRNDLLKLPNVYGDVAGTLDMIDGNHISFRENIHIVRNY
jgi:ADP-ribose pyrophosphatase YjhB (NUDIX family)